MELIVGLILGAVILAVGYVVKRKWDEHQTRKERTKLRESWDEPYKCDVCNEILDETNHHKIVVRPQDEVEKEWSGIGAGTAMVADTCPDHCEGGCNRGCEKKD